jgi:predicted ATPase/DNA-binding XRE family transcriptional regulator
MKVDAPVSFATQLKAHREAAGFTQEELATIAGLSVHAVSALERGERRRPQFETVRALCGALELTGPVRDALLGSARSLTTSIASRMAAASVPLPLTALRGRDSDVETLRRWLADPTVRLITLVGPGGVGKTRLGLELAHDIAREAATHVVFVPLAAIREPEYVASAIAEGLGLMDVNAADLPQRARAACDAPTLLLLDNFEQVLAAAPLIAELLGAVALLRFLVTSRAALKVRGEREYTVSPLELETEAVRLFVERVRDVQPDFGLTPANLPAVTAICRRVDALPLAIELAAPWMKTLTTDDLLRRLEQDVLSSTVGRRDLPERQQTINATVAWSYQLLTRAEQRAFRRFGALPGLFPIDAAAAVLAGGDEHRSSIDDALLAAARLIDRSLLVRSDVAVVPTCSLYYMLDTVRAYAASELAAAGERDDAFEGLVRYCRAESALARSGLVGVDQIEWLDRVREDLESYRSALAWLMDRQRVVEASEVAWALAFFWLIRGRGIEGLQWYERIAAQPSLPPIAEARACLGIALISYSHGNMARVRDAATRSLTVAHDIPDWDLVAQANHLLGHLELADGNIAAARERFTRSIERFETIASPWGKGSALTGMAWAAVSGGKANDVEQLLDQATSELQQAGPWFLSLVRYLRAIVAVRRGAADEALRLMRESLIQIRDLKDKFALVYALFPLAAVAVLKHDDQLAARILGARDAVTERTGATVVDKSARDVRQLEQGLRERLGDARWSEAYAIGRRDSIDSLLKAIARFTGESTPPAVRSE